MKKTKRVLVGILLSLAMVFSGVTGVAGQLHPVYASETYTVTFSSKGNVVSTQNVEPGGVAQSFKLENTEDYKFAGWLLNGQKFDFSSPITGDITLTARWIGKTEYDEENEDDQDQLEIYDEDQIVESGDTDYQEQLTNEIPETPEISDDDVPLAAAAPEEWNDIEVPTDGDGFTAEETASGESTETEEETTSEEDAATNGDVAPEEATPEETAQTEETAVEEEQAQAEDTAVEEIPVETNEAEDIAPAEKREAEEVVPAEKNEAEEADPAEEETKEKEEAAEAGEDVEVVPAEDKAEEAKEEDKLLKAPDKFTITFDVQGHGEAPKALEAEDGETAAKPEDPAAEGYDFGGWFTDKECTTAFDFATEIKANTTLYAKWTIKTFTVSFATTRGTAPAAQIINYGETATQPALTDVGYTCTGWTLDGTAFDFSQPVRADLTLTAVWRPNVYTVHFDPNNTNLASAAGATADVSCTYDVEAKLTKNGFTRNADWEFIGWNTAANRTGTAYADLAAVKNLTAEDGATVTLYAQWNFIYKMVSGAGVSVSKLDTRGLTFQTNGFYSLFTGIAVDGTVANANNYTASAANYGTYVTLKQAFIQTLSIGQHTIQFLYSDGSVSSTFYVNNTTILNPVQTGDNSKTAMWMAILAGAAVLAVGFGLLKKKYKF